MRAALGENEGAAGDYEATQAIFAHLAADFPTVPAYRQDLAKSHHNLGVLLAGLGKRGEAEAAYRQAMGIQEQLAADFPTVPAYRQDLAKSHHNLGVLLKGLGKRPEAEAAYRRALAIHEKLAADFPTVPEYRLNLAGSHNNLGALLADLGKRGEAEADYRQALAIQEELAADFPTVPAYAVDLGGNYCNLGNLILFGGQEEAALGWFQKAIARLEPVVAQEPRLMTARQFLRNSHWNRAVALDALGRHDAATRDWERAVELDDGSAKEQLRSGLAVSRLRIFRKDKNTAGCLAAAAEYEVLKRTDAGWLYDAACNRAICAAVIREDPKTPAADAARLAKEQADLAIAWLQKAVAAGYKDAEHMKKDKDLDALRELPEFKTPLAELAKGKAPEKK